ncbi:GLIPR1-like protein 1 [Harmonia axyridis]|uniref:GLIPR1-like protein 1 n=1 Tax=Harmonia axyridis TaxID=115357 RepID=UPI001E2763E6|nr:GLIPR1-like protein 1 [Harmonia axyridis]
MNALVYDNELEYIARCWVNTCHEGGHDECRDVSRFPVGQNIYWGSTAQRPDFMTEEAVFLWFDELEYMTDVSWIHAFPGLAGLPQDGNQRGHFLQVVWAETRYVGCARVMKKNGKDGMLICNYGPTGNYVSDPVYRMARDPSDIASECTVRNRVWTALCGDVASPSEEGGARPTAGSRPSATAEPGAMGGRPLVGGHTSAPDLPVMPGSQQPSTPTPPPANTPTGAKTPDCSNEQALSPEQREYCRGLKKTGDDHGDSGTKLYNLNYATVILLVILSYDGFL